MAFASVRSACSTDIQRQRGANPGSPQCGQMYLGHHNSRLPSGLPSCEDRRGFPRNHPRPIKTVEVDFFKTFERRRRTRVLRASSTCPQAMTCRAAASGSRWNERDEILANPLFLQKLHPRARFAGWRPANGRDVIGECIFVVAVTRRKFAKHPAA